MAAPRSGYDNTPTVSWSTCKALMVNPVVVDLIPIRALNSRKFFLNTSVIYHPVQENYMADDSSRLFHLSHTEFLTHVSAVHPQSHGPWQISLPPPELLSWVVSMLHMKPCEPALHRMRDSRGCTGSGPTSVPPCWSILLSKVHPSLVSSSSKSTSIAFGTPGTPSAGWTNMGNNWFLRHGSHLQRPTSWRVCPTPENHPTHNHRPFSISASHGNSRPMGSRIPPSYEKRPSPW